MTVRAAILTRNEEDFIGDCIQSIRAVTDDIVVIDSLSTDRTREIARAQGARITEREWQGYAATRNFALGEAADVDWLLFVDADERIPAGLARELRDVAEKSADTIAGYWVARRNVVCGRIMRGSGWWPDYQLRLMRPGRCGFPEATAVHEWPYWNGTTLALDTPILHLNYRTWREFTAKQLMYARLASRTAPVPRRRSMIGTPARLLWERFVDDLGFRDGLTGITANAILAASEAHRVWLSRRLAE